MTDSAPTSMTRLRPLQPEDLPLLEEWDRDPEIVRLMGRKFEHGAPAEEWFRRISVGRTSRALAIEARDGRLIGEVEAEQIDWRRRCAEVRMLIGERRLWGRGLGADALRQFVELAFGRWDFRQLYLRVFVSNRRAIRCYTRLGFAAVGRLAPSERRGDTDAVLLMVLDRDRYRHPGNPREQTG